MYYSGVYFEKLLQSLYINPKVTPSDPTHLPLPPPASPGQVLLIS